MNDVFDGYKYDKETESSPLLSKKKYLIDYAKFVAREGAKSNINNINVIDMDSLKDSLGYTPTPKSMDLVLIASKSSIISRKSGQKIPKIANLQYYKSKANYGTKKKGISR